MDVEILEQQAIDEFLRIIERKKPIPEQIADQISVQGAPVTENKYRVRGLEYQERKALGTRTTPSIAPNPPPDLKEARLHEKIAKHPFLLHTPELYMGDLLLDAVIDEFSLPSGHRADFAYLSGHNQVIRITLVEIERASGQVFNKRSRHAAFHGDTKTGIDQIETWKESFISQDRQKALLLSLKPMLKHYPIPLFTPNDNVAKDTRIEIGYVLVVGNEEIDTKEKQDLIDDLYLNKKILFMTYPMMVEQVKKHLRYKHMIKIRTSGVHVETPSPRLSLYGDFSHDPLGVKTAGLGMSYFDTSTRGKCFYPEAIREIFYRSAGNCEMPGCSERILNNGELNGHFEPIFNNLPDKSIFPLSHPSGQDCTAVLCNTHRANVKTGKIFSPNYAQALIQKLLVRKPYSPDLDYQLMEFMSLWMDKLSSGMISLLNPLASVDENSISEVRQWTRAFMSIPLCIRPSLMKIIRGYLYTGKNYKIDRSIATCERDGAFRYLTQARLLRINSSAPSHEQVEPAIFTSGGVDKFYSLIDAHTLYTYSSICDPNGHHPVR